MLGSARIKTYLVRIGGTMKKIFLSTVIALQLLIVVSGVSFAHPAAKAVQVPFKGTIQAVETHVINFPNMFVNGSGSGNSTLLGKYSINYESEVNLLTSAGTGLFAHFVAANGDNLYAEGFGQGSPTGDPNITVVTEWLTITGGSGRFAGATGSFTMKRHVSRVTGVTSGKFAGNIVLHQGQ
jgi:hypothetical protein